MRKLNTILLTSLFLIIGTGLFAQNKLSPNTISELKQYTESRAYRTKALSSKETKAFITINPELDREKLTILGVRIAQDLGDIITATIPTNKLEEVGEIEDVIYIETGTKVYPMMDLARAAANVDNVHKGENLTQGYTGKGVIIGIVDAGFDYTHPNFRDKEGKLRIKKVWEQNYEKGTPPTPFDYGGEILTEENILKAGGDINTASHGTHVAGIATGSYSFMNDEDTIPSYYGIAPDAEIVLVSKKFNDATNLTVADAIGYIFNYADSVDKPCVINLSLGSQIGPHDGTSAFDRITDKMQKEGRLIIGASGNFGNHPIHVSKKLESKNDTLKFLTSYIEKPSIKNNGGEVDIWGTEDENFDLRISIVSTRNGKVVEYSQSISTDKAENATYNITKNAEGSVDMISEINPINNRPHIYLKFNVTQLKYKYEIGVNITSKTNNTEIHAWADDTYLRFFAEELSGYTKGNMEQTIAEIGGTGKNIISVGSYNTRTTYSTTAEPIPEETGEILGEISTFSSTGPSLDKRMKPDVYAPGSYIISSVSSNDVSISVMPLAFNFAYENKGYSYGYMQGTSMATPFVTGVVATWLEANPNLTPKDIRNVIAKTSNKIEKQGLDITNKQHSINAYEGLKECIRIASDVENVENSDIKIYANGGLLYITNEYNNISIFDITGRIILNAKNKHTLNISNIPHGIYIVVIDNKTKKITL